MRRTASSVAALLLVLTGCTSEGSDAEVASSPDAAAPLIIVPGLGMSALHVSIDRDSVKAQFNYLVPAMNPVEILPAPATSALDYSVRSGLPPEYAGEVAQWLRLDVSSDGVVSNRSGVTVNPVSIGRDLNSECPRYEAFAQSVAGAGWTPDVNLFCLPYDYRFPPGANSFTRDLRELIERVGASSKVALACHSQGCLMVYHALRTEDPQWVADHVLLLFGLAGQFSGCSDCMRWAFQQGWSWDPANALASPVDPTWAGELALDLQPSVYSNAVLYRSGAKEYRAVDARQLLEDAGAVSMARATTRYSLNRQEWFIRGERGEPLPIPARFVFGVGVPTTVGYAFDAVPSRETTCAEPVCAGFQSQLYPDVIQADGDGGDSSWMNRAPAAWTTDPSCAIAELPFVGHMDILTNESAINALTKAVQGTVEGRVPCIT